MGDDWQAINGFAGSDLRFYEGFRDVFQPSRQITMATNYRSASSIVAISNALMYGRGQPARANTQASGTVLLANLEVFEPTPREQEDHSDNSLVPAVLRLVSAVAFSGAFLWLGGLINRLHRKKHGVSHPAMKGYFSL